PLSIGIAPENSSSEQDTLIRLELNLQPHDTVIIHINGTTDPSGYQPYLPLNMQLIAQSRENPHVDPNGTDLFFLFGSIDEGTVDIRSGAETLVKDGGMGDYSPYFSYENGHHFIRRTDETGRIIHGTYSLNLANWAWPGRTA